MPAEGFGQEDGRDLITPPVVEDGTNDATSLSGNDQGERPNCVTQARNVRISISSADAVHEAISIMAHQSGHDHKLSPRMECES